MFVSLKKKNSFAGTLSYPRKSCFALYCPFEQVNKMNKSELATAMHRGQ